MKFKFTIFFITLYIFSINVWGQKEYNTPGCFNPFIPGYFADPTIKKFGDTYYIYATTLIRQNEMYCFCKTKCDYFLQNEMY